METAIERPHPTTEPSNHNAPDAFVSDGTYSRFVRVDGEWRISLAPDLARIVQIGTAITCEVETARGHRYTRSGTVISVRRDTYAGDTALCEINEWRPGRPADGRNSFYHLEDRRWGVRLHATASARARIGDELTVAVTTRNGRISHMLVLVTKFIENAEGDRQAIAEILRRDVTPPPTYDPDDGVTQPCPTCGTSACESGITGQCRLSPEHAPQCDDLPVADTPREDNDTHIEPIGRAQDEDHWTRHIDRMDGFELAHATGLDARRVSEWDTREPATRTRAKRRRPARPQRRFADRWVLPDPADLRP